MSRKLYEAKQQSKPVKLSSRLDVPFIISNIRSKTVTPLQKCVPKITRHFSRF